MGRGGGSNNRRGGGGGGGGRKGGSGKRQSAPQPAKKQQQQRQRDGRNGGQGKKQQDARKAKPVAVKTRSSAPVAPRVRITPTTIKHDFIEQGVSEQFLRGLAVEHLEASKAKKVLSSDADLVDESALAQRAKRFAGLTDGTAVAAVAAEGVAVDPEVVAKREERFMSEAEKELAAALARRVARFGGAAPVASPTA